MNSNQPSDYDCFEALIQQLRAEGYDEPAQAIHSLLHETAWTTSSELYGELGLAILAFERQEQEKPLSAELRRSLKMAMKSVKRVWPGIK